MNGVQELDHFKRLVAALEPWLGQLVIVGGWAHQLYRLHPNAQALPYQALLTLDTDVAVPSTLPIGKQDIRERLLSYGFTEEFLGDLHPPATHYRLVSSNSGFYAEFLTPLTGSAYNRENKRKATVKIGGITSQQLRHIELLLKHPWIVELDTGESVADVQMANPVSFIAQKVLIHKKRHREDRAKDLLYIHDTFEVFGSQLP